jgi:hypothetical protein
MMDAVHDRHWRLAIPRDRDRIARPWPSRFQPAPEFLAEVISHANYPKKLLADNRS